MVSHGPLQTPPQLSLQHNPESQGFGVLRTAGAAQRRPGHTLPTDMVSPSHGTVGAGEGQSARTGLASAPCSGVMPCVGLSWMRGSGAGLGTPLLPTGAELAVTEQFNKDPRYCRGARLPSPQCDPKEGQGGGTAQQGQQSGPGTGEHRPHSAAPGAPPNSGGLEHLVPRLGGQKGPSGEGL